ncbi:hypothetical protein BD310DRAFT_981878 [Dichomitus squalens]|uniref:Uncharacterized protein n=1 Tax=Dichomitus squalens TaxID=114155 RepID=A0A4Q9PEA1_9APHY|nr:hypothetical protein BD310DRAFT_981878 [Dichomitus squalens]
MVSLKRASAREEWEMSDAVADNGVHEDGAGGGWRDGYTGEAVQADRPDEDVHLQLACLSNECCLFENEKNALEGSIQIVSD